MERKNALQALRYVDLACYFRPKSNDLWFYEEQNASFVGIGIKKLKPQPKQYSNCNIKTFSTLHRHLME